ncbi:MAG TPA: TetR/AcrR family transcriptional regulator [Terriglobales bacterium]|nr:TetR/AcrR family transcriptional regulator [Terriglobales bacterium]
MRATHISRAADRDTRTLGARRRTRSKERALTTAAQILRDEGYSQLTMERIAARSGLAKTTLYRRWPTKAALCMELYLEVAKRELQDPNRGDIESDLTEICNTVVSLQTRTVAGQAFVGVIAEAQANTALHSRALADFAERRREITRRILKRAIERGELRPDTDIDLVIDAIGGATTFRLLQRHAPLTRKFANDLVKLVLLGCKSRQSHRKS